MRRFVASAFTVCSLALPAYAQLASATDIDALLNAIPGVVAHYDAKAQTGDVLALDNLTISLKKADGTADGANKVFIKHAEITGLDGEAILSIVDGSRYGAEPDQTFKTLFSRAEVREALVTVMGATVITVASKSVERLEMKQFWFKPGPDMRAQFSSDKEMAAKVIGNLLDSIRVGPASASGIHFEIDPAIFMAVIPHPAGAQPIPPAAMGGKTSVDYGTIRIEGLDRGKWLKTEAADMSSQSLGSAAGFEIRASVKKTVYDGMDVSRLLPWLMRAEWPPVTEREGLISIGQSCVEGFAESLSDIGTISIPQSCMEPISFVWLIPQHVKFDVSGTFTPAFSGKFALPDYAAKYFTAPMDVRILLEASYEPEAGTATVSHYGISLGTFGSLDMSGTAGGLMLANLPALPAAVDQMLSFNAAGFVITDEGGLAKILDIASSATNAMNADPKTHVTPDALKMQAKSGLDIVQGVLGNTAEVAAFTSAIKAFVDQGGTLMIKANPPVPLKGADFKTMTGKPPSETFKAYGLTAEQR